MNIARSKSVWLVGFCGLSLLAGCEEEKPKPEAKTPPASPAPATTAAATAATASASAAAPDKAAARPVKIDTELTVARRAAIESAHGAAKGFLVGSELEAKLKADKTLKDKKAAVAAFDRAARGKWVLFASPLVNLTDDGFDVGVVYTPQLAGDPMGMSRQFFEVTLTKVEGYRKDAFQAGNMVVVLVKYEGAGKASPGYELVSSGVWK
jgi:hypothetical protein